MPSLNGNWVDLVIIAVLIYFAYENWGRGIWLALADFLSFVFSLLISLRAYKFTSSILKSNFSLTDSLSDAIGFLLTSFAIEIILANVAAFVIEKIRAGKWKIKKLWKPAWGRPLGLLFGIGEGIVFIAFVLTFLLSLPINPNIKTDISKSKIGGYITKRTSGIEKSLNDIFGGVINDSLTYMTIEPKAKESVPLNNDKSDLSVDEKGEAEMFAFTNTEREKRGIKTLTWSPEIVAVARAYAKDMWVRHYFSHYSPEGQDVGDRLVAAHISFTIAGENLALAPTTQIAHNGLMNSEGHRDNILDTRFHKVGIGMIDNGYYGKMIVEVFTN